MLTERQLREFGVRGYLVLPGVVPERLLEPVDAEIDALVHESPPPAGTAGNHFYFLTPGRLPAADAALRDSAALGLAEALVTPWTLDHGLDHIQIALNIPPFAHRPGGPHIDGHRPEQAEPGSFTMLAGVYLVDETVPDSPSSATHSGPKPARRSCSAVPYRICLAGLTALHPTRTRKAISVRAAAVSTATHAPWLKPHSPAGTAPTSSARASSPWPRSSACNRYGTSPPGGHARRS